MEQSDIAGPLLAWYDKHKRELPWRDINNPYYTWVSEIMLQQTRVDQARPYYERFIKSFPTVHELAQAGQQEVLKAWEGLGYYSRARNLHHAAQTVIKEFNGKIPETYDHITALKGIGPYTAAAILSIAFNKRYAVVDGNVIRVLTRYWGIKDDVRASATKKKIQKLADDFLPQERPGDFNQAVMELGATVCLPASPKCKTCPLEAQCTAARQAETDTIPYKSPRKKVPHHNIGIGIITSNNGKVLIALRPEDAMLGGLWEFPGGKRKDDENMEQTVVRELKEELGVEVEIEQFFTKLKHAYSHFKITLHAYICRIKKGNPQPSASQKIKWVSLDNLEQYPFPKANKTIIKKLLRDYQGGAFNMNREETSSHYSISDTRLTQLKPYLEKLVRLTETPDYINDDPILFLHAYNNRHDRLLGGFFAALMAWGRRDIVLTKVEDLMQRMNHQPARFIQSYSPADRHVFKGFKHRTFKPVDMHWLATILQRIYARYNDFEHFWSHCFKAVNQEPKALMASFHDRFFAMAPEAAERTRKHVSTSAKNSACKRLWLYLRWTVRTGSPVDIPLMHFIDPSNLMIPLDVHVGRQARKLGLLKRTYNDWKAVLELTAVLNRIDPDDPAKYDYALFGMGIYPREIPDELLVSNTS